MSRLSAPLLELLQTLRARRGFDARRWIEAKTLLLNTYLAQSSLSACVVGVSGGVDSALTLALAVEASRAPGSPIRRVVPALIPMFVREGATNQDTATARGREVAEAYGLTAALVDLSASLTTMREAVEKGFGRAGSAWAAGQLVSYHRTPALYYLATLLTDAGDPALLLGTTNRDEGAYLGFFGKASDGMVDLQLISDAHKSEVYAAARLLKVPQPVLDAVPTGDTFDGRVDEEMIGAPYDAVELHALCRTMGVAWPPEFQRWADAIEALHAKNAHKYLGASPAVHLDVYPREVGAPVRPEPSPETSRFVGLFAAPQGLTARLENAPPLSAPKSIADCGESAVLVEGALSAAECAELVAAVAAQPRVPAGLDGRTSSYERGTTGSLRASLFDRQLAAALWQRLAGQLPRIRVMNARTPTDHHDHPVWRATGLSPLLRFIWYEPGGLLVPHYDAGFDAGDGRHTLMSVLFFLTTGGATRLLVDRQRHLPVSERSFPDGVAPPPPRDVLARIAPPAGAALVFDHRMPHDAEAWAGPGPRVLLRADVFFERCGLSTPVERAPRPPPKDRDATFTAKLLADPHYASAYPVLGTAEAIEEAGFFADAAPVPNLDPRRDPRWRVTPLHKISNRLKTAPADKPLAVLVSTGGFSPIHRGHLEMMELARAELERKGFFVAGGYISPSHDAYVLPKCNFQVPAAPHRIRLCERAVEASDWLMVDPWEAMHTDVAVNFTDVLQRLEAYFSLHLDLHRPVEVAYVFGSDNARFALTFAARGRGVCITRPGYEAQAKKYAEHPHVKGNPRVHMLAHKSAEAASRDIREGREGSLAEELRPLWRSWTRGAPDQRDYAILYVRDEGDWAIEPWLKGRDAAALRVARERFQDQLLQLLKRVYATARPPDVPCQIQLEVRRLDDQRAAAAAAIGDEKFISLDPCLGGAIDLGLSRSFELCADVGRGAVARPGWPSLDEQLARIAPGKYVLVDDDRATGRTLAEAQALLSKRCTITRTVLLCEPEGKPAPGAAGPPAFVDLVDFRDFLAGARDSGLVVALPDGTLARAPYALPYVRPSSRISVPLSTEQAFSREVWQLSAAFFASVQPAITLAEAGAAFRALCERTGLEARATMEEVCRWHAARLG